MGLKTSKPVRINRLDFPFVVNHYRWPSGLQLLHQPEHQAPLVSYQTWLKVGSSHEETGKTGIAHLFEHLMFKGTQKHPEGELDRLLEEVGGDVNAATWLDWTYYYTDLPSEHVERVVMLEADRLSQLHLTAEVLEAERQVVMNERRECVEDDPCESVSEILWSKLMGEGHPYAHTTIGLMEDIEQLSLEDCRAFYKRFYHPSQITLVVSGDITAEAIIDMIETHYGEELSISQPQHHISFPTPAPVEEEWIEEEMELHAPRIHLGFRTYAAHDHRSAALECLDELLFEGDSSRLYKRLIFDLEVASCVYSVMPQFSGEGVYEIVIELLPDSDAQAVVNEVTDELTRISQYGILDEELARVKLAKELYSYRSLQTVQQRAFCLGFWQSTCNDFQQSFSRLTSLQGVKNDHIIEVAKDLLKPEGRLALIGRPKR